MFLLLLLLLLLSLCFCCCCCCLFFVLFDFCLLVSLTIFVVFVLLVDAGGLFRDVLSHISRELQASIACCSSLSHIAHVCFSFFAFSQSDALPLFVSCPNARAGVGINQVRCRLLFIVGIFVIV